MSSKPSIPPTIPPTSGASSLPCAEEPAVLVPLGVFIGGVVVDVTVEEIVDDREVGGVLSEDDALADADEGAMSVTSGRSLCQAVSKRS